MIVYCDYIAHLIQKNLHDNDYEWLLEEVGKVQFHLDDGGQFASTRKTIRVVDKFGKEYNITVEEAK